MKIAYAFLATNADFGSDGKLHLFGADVNKVTVSQFPATLSEWHLVARVDLNRDDLGKTYKLQIDFQEPEGEWNTILSQDATSDIAIEFPELSPNFKIVIRTILTVRKPGLHNLRISIAHLEPAVVPFLVILAQPT